MATAAIEILIMLDMRNPILWLIGFVVLAVFLFLLRGRFSTEARARRRREIRIRPVISRKQVPTVWLAVDVGKPKRDRKR
jgi:hypothetical protein